MTTLREEIAGATTSLQEVGCDTPRLDAELLLAHVLGVDRAQLVIRAQEEASPDARTRYLALLTRRAKREPVAYILGRRDFRNITLVVDPRVLIPRPETELLVEVGLTLPEGAHVADVGTGSGAIALALKQERPDLGVVGIDLKPGALSVARMNAQRLRLDVEFVQGDLLELQDHSETGEFAGSSTGTPAATPPGTPAASRFDAVLANLPYVAESELLAPEVARYEPPSALLAGPEGLDVIRRLVSQLHEYPHVKLVALEIGATQGDAVTALVQEAGFGDVQRLRDLAGHERAIVGRR